MIEPLPEAWVLYSDHDTIERVTGANTDGRTLYHPLGGRQAGRWARTEAEAVALLRRHLRAKADRLRADLDAVTAKLLALPPEPS